MRLGAARLVCVAVAFFALAADASGSLPEDSQGEEITRRPDVGRALDAANRHWRAKPDCPVRVWAYWGETAGMAETPGCRIWIRGDFTPDRYGYRWFCALVVHEAGHNLGYSHDHPDPVMRPVIASTPAECRPPRRASRRARAARKRPRAWCASRKCRYG